jgi:hypothetical protein
MDAALPAGVYQLQERIENWRRTRERRTAMPAELWVEAVALARIGRPCAVARALRINVTGIKRRMAKGGDGGRAAGQTAFVELSGAQVLGARPPPGSAARPWVDLESSSPGAVVELSDRDGVRLTVRLAAGVEVDVAGVVAAFRQHGA